MTVTEKGFVQRHEQQAKEGTLYQNIDEHLDRMYGKPRPNISLGLKWLTGLDGYDTYLDHPEYRVKNGLKTIVARPYGLSLKQIEKLVEIAKTKNIRLHIDSPSNYNLDTLLVILTQQ